MREYVVVYKDLILKYDFKKAVVLQYLINIGGEYIGSPRRLSEEIGILSYQQVCVALRELIKAKALKKSKVTVRTYKYLIQDDIKNPEEKSTK